MRVELSIELDEGQSVEKAVAGIKEFAANFGEVDILDVDYEGEIPSNV
jgi:hypothetical protein